MDNRIKAPKKYALNWSFVVINSIVSPLYTQQRNGLNILTSIAKSESAKVTFPK
jgi:predicted site-specific integrase-resolvase